MTAITTYEELANFNRRFAAGTQVTGELARKICTLAEVDADSPVYVTRRYREFRVNGDVIRTPDHRIQVGWRDMGLDGILELLATPTP